MSALALPRPNNLDTRFGDVVEADMFHIAERIKELDPRLFIAFHPDRDKKYAIIEQCADNVDRLVYRTERLDARVIEHLQYLQRVPFEQRLAEADRIASKSDADMIEADKDEMYERVGAPMLPLLHRTGAIDHRRESYPKTGVTGGKGSKRRGA